MKEGAIEDIRRLLAMTWRTWGDEPLDANSITRTWSLDLGWLNPENAETLLTRLIAAGWIVSSGDLLKVNVSLQGVEVPLGWYPRQRVISEPPSAPTSSPEKMKTDVVNGSLTKPQDVENVGHKQTAKLNSTDNKESTQTPVELSIEDSGAIHDMDIPSLLQFVSRESKLARPEVMRRANRKRKALQFVTTNAALILVARELGVELS